MKQYLYYIGDDIINMEMDDIITRLQTELDIEVIHSHNHQSSSDHSQYFIFASFQLLALSDGTILVN